MNRLLPVLALAAALASPSLGFAQAVKTGSDFEAAEFPPSGWSVIDQDGDANTWLRFDGPASFITQFGSSKACAVSFGMKYETGVSLGAQDNWLITPPIEITNDKFAVSFNYAAQDIDSDESMEILVSEGGVAPEDFQTLYQETVSNGYDDDISNQSTERSLAAYNGKTIRIAVRHTTHGYGSWALSVDNFYVYDNLGPKKPTGFSAVAAAGGILEATLSWTSPSQAADGSQLGDDLKIHILRDGEEIAVVDGTPGQKQTWTDTAALGGNHRYTVAASNSHGRTLPLNGSSIYVGPDYPAPVKNLMSMYVDGGANLTWDAPTAGANKGVIDLSAITYKVFRTVAGVEQLIASDLTSTGYRDENPVAGAQNLYIVRACNSGGDSNIDDTTGIYVAAEDEDEFAVAQTPDRNNSLQRLPLDLNSKNSVSQSIYYPSDLGYAKGQIKALVYKIYKGTDSEVDFPFDIYMHETETADLSGGWDRAVSPSDLVFSGTLKVGQGPRDYRIDLTSPYEYNGGNLIVTFVKNNPPNGSYSDRFYSMELADPTVRSYTGSTYDPVDISSLPSFSSYSEKKVNQLPSTRFIMEATGVTSLSGVVTNSSDNSPIEGVEVSIESYGLKTFTKADGSYRLSYVPLDAPSASFSVAGFAPKTMNLSLAEGIPSTLDVQLVQNANFTLTGSLVCGDTRLPASGAKVRLSGYATLSVIADEQGAFSISPVYSNEDYTITAEYPGYDLYLMDVNADADTDTGLLELSRAAIAPFDVRLEVAEDGSLVDLTWGEPLDRDVEIGWNSMNADITPKSTGGDKYYAPDNYNVAHFFNASTMAERHLVGTSVSGLRVWLKASEGQFIAKVWEGTRDANVMIGSQEIDPAQVSAAGSWVEVRFETPVEIREGRDYLIGLQCLDASEYPIGCAAKYTSGVDNIKWDDNGLIYYNAYDGWSLEADFEVPGTTLPLPSADIQLPPCEYNVYRSSDEGWIKINPTPLKEPVYSDRGWASLLSGDYTYGVSAIYLQNESPKALSETLSRSNDTDAGVSAILSPAKQTERQEEVSFIFEITNYGEKPLQEIPYAVELNGERILEGTAEGSLNKGQTLTVEAGSHAISEGIHDIAIRTLLPGDMSAANDVATMVLPNLMNVHLTGYRWNAYGNAGFMAIESNNPEGASFLREVTPNDALITAAEYLEGRIYAFTATWYGAPKEFVMIDNGVWSVENHLENTEDYVMDLAYDYQTRTMYALRPEGEDMYLATIDLTTGYAYPKALIDRHVLALACSTDGRLSAIDGEGNFCDIDPETGATTIVGNTMAEGEVKYLQSMAYDHNTDRLFWAQTGNLTDGTLREIDPATGESRALGQVLYLNSEPSEIVGLLTPYTHPTIGVSLPCESVLALASIGEGRVRLNAVSETTVSVYDSAGMLVKRVAAEAGESVIDLDLPQGIYMVVASDARESATLKVRI